MRDPHRWEELLPEEFHEEFDRTPIAYWACGAMEEHGLQNALGTDPFTAYEICLRAVSISGGILLPPVPLAPAYIPGLSREELRSKERELFPPSLWVSREACERVYTELMESMADLGFKVCMATGGHYPAELLLRDLEEKLGGRIGNMKFWGGGTIRLLGEALEKEVEKDPDITGHGMMWETSLVCALNSEWVDLPRASRIKESPLPSQLKPQPDRMITKIQEANASFGERMLTIASENLARIAREMLAR